MARRKVFLLLLLLALAAAAAGLTSRPSRGLNIERLETVERVLDGDTIVLSGGERVRLVGVNAPELHPKPQPGAMEAKKFVEGFCWQGSVVGLDVDDVRPKDRYGRTLAVVYVRVDNSWVNLNAELLRRGLAEVLHLSPSEFNPYRWTKG
ncbi:MAG: thermonuclease family protein [Hadesarchaea archaeon]|nr:thermonuclease family protein [Hadesarchaea archaeon]